MSLQRALRGAVVELPKKLVVVLAGPAASLLLSINNFRMIVVTMPFVTPFVSGRLNESLIIVTLTAPCNAIVF